MNQIILFNEMEIRNSYVYKQMKYLRRWKIYEVCNFSLKTQSIYRCYFL